MIPPYPNEEIHRLRKEGKINEALQYGKDALQKDPDNPWIKGALAWVYYDMAKHNLDNTSAFIEHIEEIIKLGLDEKEKILYDSLGFLIGKKIFRIIRQKDFPKLPLNKLFELSKQMHFRKPGDAYSFLFKAFHSAYKDSSKYIEFADWWGFENFQAKDYEKEEINGEKSMSIVERAYIAYAKAILKGEPTFSGTGLIENPFDSSDPSIKMKVNKEKARDFLPKLDKIIEYHPEYQFLLYYKAKLLLAIDRKDEALKFFIPFARKKQREYWVWEDFIDFFSDNADLHIAFYCKALSLRTNEKYLVNLRQKFAAILVKKGFFAEAKSQIEKLVQTRNKEGWKVPSIVQLWRSQDWYQATHSISEKDFCRKYLPEAEKILYQDVPEEIIVVSHVNKPKKVIHFIKDKSKHGFFKYFGNINRVQQGDILKVRFNGKGQDEYYKIFSLRNAEPDTTSEALKKFYGTLNLIPGKNFGFVEEVFVPPYLKIKYKLNDGEMVKGKAILSFDKQKNRWGWKMVDILDD